MNVGCDTDSCCTRRESELVATLDLLGSNERTRRMGPSSSEVAHTWVPQVVESKVTADTDVVSAAFPLKHCFRTSRHVVFIASPKSSRSVATPSITRATGNSKGSPYARVSCTGLAEGRCFQHCEFQLNRSQASAKESDQQAQP